MSDDNLSQNQPNPSRDLSGFCVLNHFSSNYREASCYSLHLFNPPERKKEPNSHFPQGLSTLSIIQKFLQLTKAMNRRAVSVSSSLFTWLRQTLKIASTYCTVLSSWGRGYRRESGDGGSLPRCAFPQLWNTHELTMGKLHLIDEAQVSPQIAILGNRKGLRTVLALHVSPWINLSNLGQEKTGLTWVNWVKLANLAPKPSFVCGFFLFVWSCPLHWVSKIA